MHSRALKCVATLVLTGFGRSLVRRHNVSVADVKPAELTNPLEMVVTDFLGARPRIPFPTVFVCAVQEI